jgi:hypothetical protein
VSHVVAGRLGVQIGDEVLEGPGAFASYFDELEPLIAAGDLAGLGALAARYGLALDVVSVPRLINAHGLNG